MGSKYTSAVRIIRNNTKFEDTKEHFISEGLLNICKLHIFSLNTTMHLQIPAVQKQPFPLWPFQRVFRVYPTNPL